MTFSGKDCVCQNCSQALLSTKPIKIHGPSREFPAGYRERGPVPLGRVAGQDLGWLWVSQRFGRRDGAVLRVQPGLELVWETLLGCW